MPGLSLATQIYTGKEGVGAAAGTRSLVDIVLSYTPMDPLTLVLNTKGQVIARHEGRIAPEAWDDVAEALP